MKQRDAPTPNDAALHGRFAIAVFEDGGVLMNLTTGTLLKLNPLAAQIAAGLLQGSAMEDLASEVSQRFGVSPTVAAGDIQAVSAGLLDTGATEIGPSSVSQPASFDSNAAGFLMRWNGQAVLQVDIGQKKLTYHEPSVWTPEERRLQLQFALPHILSLQHQPVIHASAVRLGNGVLAFCGASGAGKSTLARLFIAQGAESIARDLLLIVERDQTLVVPTDGEAAMLDWVNAASAELASGSTREIAIADPEEMLGGPDLPLHRLLCIDRTRRSGVGIRRERLSHADELKLILDNSLIALDRSDVWRTLLEFCQRIVAADIVRYATVPMGLPALEAAVREYNTIS